MQQLKSNLNMDFSKKVMIDTNQLEWLPSPLKGVTRKPLAREDLESGHATSIVKYQAGSHFKRHSHPQGEEILVLEGVFSDETGDFGPGTYIRNPPGSSHRPFSTDGCTLFVKLNQFDKNDLQQVRVDTHSTPWQRGMGGLEVMSLHDFEGQHTALVKWPADEVFQPHRHFGGEEILVLSGLFEDEHGQYPANTWIRSPHMSQHHPFVKEETIILVKVGHLPV
ncbi:cupin domain-containing protein [Shewanella woodyi]|uniref:Anti-ECFsigma factor, ChrR n=1 Tax=Shewanella woodyi (strain ATCC 51908 / MS32) TaxID=392500 RepID=B1KKE3_SHEWM|nr:cupin domain-containing protein [Shewanella woodyi]ACA85783.1 anti-ECFsigma factor, ChrR [Shewanella woodyi ATCC 51908]